MNRRNAIYDSNKEIFVMNNPYFRGNLGVAALRGASTRRRSHGQAMREFNMYAEKNKVWKANRQRRYEMDIQQMEFQRNLRIKRAWVEGFAMGMATETEKYYGAKVIDVSTPENARRFGFSIYPGFDLVSVYPSGDVRYIEVKGHRFGSSGINLTRKEWESARILGEQYWLYDVIDCGTNSSRLFEIRNPYCRMRRGFGISCLGYR